jgi:hypothetical protein
VPALEPEDLSGEHALTGGRRHPQDRRRLCLWWICWRGGNRGRFILWWDHRDEGGASAPERFPRNGWRPDHQYADAGGQTDQRAGGSATPGIRWLERYGLSEGVPLEQASSRAEQETRSGARSLDVREEQTRQPIESQSALEITQALEESW